MRRKVNLIEATDIRDAVHERGLEAGAAGDGLPDVVAQALANPFDERILADHLSRYDIDVEGLGRTVIFYG